MKIWSLHAIVTGRDLTELRPMYREPTFMASDEGPWVFQLAQELTTKLAQLPQAEMPRVASLWAATDEFAGWDVSTVAGVLDDIVGLAQRAHASEKVLFLWVSL